MFSKDGSLKGVTVGVQYTETVCFYEDILTLLYRTSAVKKKVL